MCACVDLCRSIHWDVKHLSCVIAVVTVVFVVALLFFFYCFLNYKLRKIRTPKWMFVVVSTDEVRNCRWKFWYSEVFFQMSQQVYFFPGKSINRIYSFNDVSANVWRNNWIVLTILFLKLIHPLCSIWNQNSYSQLYSHPTAKTKQQVGKNVSSRFSYIARLRLQ